MKLFKFYPGPFIRIYTIANSPEDIFSKKDKLFDEFIAEHYDWIDLNDPFDQDDLEKIREDFMNGLKNTLEESKSHMFIDAHY